MLSLRRIRANVILHERKDFQRAVIATADFVRSLHERRALLYVAGIALALLILVILNPVVSAHAVAVNGAMPTAVQPSSIIQNGTQGNPNFLGFNRWMWAIDLPSPNSGVFSLGAAMSSGIRTIASVILMLPALGFWALGIIMHIGFGMFNFSGITRMADEWFSISYKAIMEPAAEATGLGNNMTMIMLAFFVMLIVTVLALIFRRRSGGTFGTIAFSLMLLVALTVMGGQSAKNDSTDDGILERGGNYYLLSAGWMLEKVDQTVGIVSTTLNGAVASISSALGETGSGKQLSGSYASGACGHYVEAMHDIYQYGFANAQRGVSGPVGANGTQNNLGLVVAYDNLYMSSLRSLLNSTIYGVGSSTSNSWCQIADIQSGIDVGYTVTTAVVADLYEDVVDAQIVNTNNMTWKEQGEAKAEIFFGSGKMALSARNAYPFYFAACQWVDDDNNVVSNVRVNPDWDGVKVAKRDGFQEGLSNLIEIFPWLSDDENLAAGIKSKHCSVAATAIDNKVKDFDFTIDPEDYVWGAFNFSISPASKLTEWFLNDDSNQFMPEPFRFWSALSGGVAPLALVISSLAMTAVTIIIIKDFAPLVVASVAAPLIQAIAAMILPFGMVIGVVPSKNLQRPFKILVTMILFSALTIMVFGLVVSFGIAIIHLIYRILSSVTGLVRLTDSINFFQFVIVAVSVITGIMALKFVLTKIFKIDMSSFKSAVGTALMASGGAALAHGGVGGGMFENPWTNGKMLNTPKREGVIGKTARNASNSARNAARNAATNKAKDWGKKATSGLMENLRGGKPGATDSPLNAADKAMPSAGVGVLEAGTGKLEAMRQVGANFVQGGGRQRFEGPINPNTPSGGALGPGKVFPELETASRSDERLRKELDGHAVKTAMDQSGISTMSPEITPDEAKRLTGMGTTEALGFTPRDMKDANAAVGPIVMAEGADGTWGMDVEATSKEMLNPAGDGFTSEAFFAATERMDDANVISAGENYGTSFADRTLTQASMFQENEPILTDSGEIKNFAELPASDLNTSNLEGAPAIAAIAMPSTDVTEDRGVPTSIMDMLRESTNGEQVEQTMQETSRLLGDIAASVQESVSSLKDNLPEGAMPFTHDQMQSLIQDQSRNIGEEIDSRMVEGGMRTFSEGIATGIQGASDAGIRESDLERALSHMHSEIALTERESLEMLRFQNDPTSQHASQSAEQARTIWFSDIPDVARQSEIGDGANERLVRRAMGRIIGEQNSTE